MHAAGSGHTFGLARARFAKWVKFNVTDQQFRMFDKLAGEVISL